ncbi:MAG: DUF1580 domain-containing protein [Gemmataceae bacterium]
MIDFSEPLIPLTKAGSLFPGRRPHSATVVRWALRGVQLGKFKLDTVLVGGRRFTTKSAVFDFLTRLNAPMSRPGYLSRRRSAAIRAAEHRLDAEQIR